MDVGPQQLEILVQEDDGRARVLLRGELDVATAAALMQCLATLNRTGVRQLTLDMSELSYIDPGGLSLLAVEQQRATASGMVLHIDDPTAFVRDLLTRTGLMDVLTVSPESDAAA